MSSQSRTSDINETKDVVDDLDLDEEVVEKRTQEESKSDEKISTKEITNEEDDEPEAREEKLSEEAVDEKREDSSDKAVEEKKIGANENVTHPTGESKDKEREEEEGGEEEGEEGEGEEGEEEEGEKASKETEDVEEGIETKEVKEGAKKDFELEPKKDNEGDLEEISLKDETPKASDAPSGTSLPPPKPTRPQRLAPPSQPPRPKSKSVTPSLSQRPPTPNGQNNFLTSQLKDAFPDIPTKVLMAIAIASQNNIELCYDACLYYMDPAEFKPTFHPDNFIQKEKNLVATEQMKQDEIMARNLDRKYNNRPPPPPRSRTLRERDTRVENGNIKRGQLPNEYDSDDNDDFGEEDVVKNFIDNDLPAITQNVGKTFKDTSNKVGSWIRSFQGDNANEENPNTKKSVESFKKQLNSSYQYDEWGNPVFEHNKTYKILERSPSNDSKVIPQRFPVKTPSKEAGNKPYINTPSTIPEKQKQPPLQQQRSVSGGGNKRLVFVEPVDNKENESLKPRSSIDDDLNLSD